MNTINMSENQWVYKDTGAKIIGSDDTNRDVKKSN